ncbi:hypothetical protein MRX96_058762 [Rhipicephalus microplus]
MHAMSPFFFCVCRGAPTIAAISTQTAVGRSPRLTWFFVLLRRSPSSTSKYATFVDAFTLFRFAGVPALTLPKTTNIRAAVPTFASASQTPPRQTRFAVLVRRWPAGTSKDADIVRELALLGFTGVPPLTPPKTAKIRAALPTFASASRAPPRLTRFTVLVRRSPASTSNDGDIVPESAPFGFAGVPALARPKTANIRATVLTIAYASQTPPQQTHFAVLVRTVAGEHVERRRYRARVGPVWLWRSASTHSATNGEHPSGGSHLAVGVPNSARQTRLPSSCD